MRLLSAKQQLIAVLQTLEKELGPFHDEDPDGRQWSSPAVRRVRLADADHCRRLIQEVVALEQSGERQLTIRRDEAATQLRAVHAAGAGAGGVREADVRKRGLSGRVS